ncbi:MAG: nucleoside triphosphate pyrophosphohydrolase [Syntrophobacteraceae bacterium]
MVHWIVQECAESKAKGHLSNERHLRKEKRDWLAEFEPKERKLGYGIHLAVRNWRDGKGLADTDLRCSSDFEISLVLKRVAMWASRFSSRIHFEWVWDGSKVHIVQVDAAEQATGSDPRLLLKNPMVVSVRPAKPSLKLFRPANPEDLQRYRKLQNAKVYAELGYKMPTFYVLNDPDALGIILTGQIPPEVQEDLIELTKRSLVIRTDGENIPEDKREMLPRSEELCSPASAVNWLLAQFKPKAEENQLQGGGLCLIAHHFIPSTASAWARAVPSGRIVRIESPWGIPEGLYWYRHDTFEVDTQTVDIDSRRTSSPLKYTYRKKLRYKARFIASDQNGNWRTYLTLPPCDWKESVTRKDWLFEIARTTRQVAEREGYAVSVMWFIDNDSQVTDEKVLPWFHSKSELGSPKAAPRQKYRVARDFTIRNGTDWQQLQRDLQSRRRIERVVVEPEDPELIRNLEFTRELARLAALPKPSGFVIELYGGILSHAYYVLKREGAEVECIDLFGADEDAVEFNKVVRDKIPDIIVGRGERVETVRLKGNALRFALQQKLVEEAFEALDAKSGVELIGELADIQEVVRALCRTLEVNASDIETERQGKEKRRGGFEKGLMLMETSTPHSIVSSSTIGPEILTDRPYEIIISEIAYLPPATLYSRPDLRQVDHELEKMFTFETEINKIGEIKQSLNFSMPISDKEQQDFTLTMQFRRISSSLRAVVRLALRRPLQLELKFTKRFQTKRHD